MPADLKIQIDPEKIGALIGPGGKTIRALQEEFESQIDVNDEGQVLVYASDGERGDALVDRIRSMTKEVEIGDEFTGKVIEATTFGAFIELAKGTDGLLHISNVAPGRRIDNGRGRPQQGRRAPGSVVVEVDRERGRIGLRLADDPEVAGKSIEELASVGSGDGETSPRARRRPRSRAQRPRPGPGPRTARWRTSVTPRSRPPRCGPWPPSPS